MAAVKEILENKDQTKVWSISVDASVFSAIEKMAEKDVGALVVTQKEDIVGIITERDYARKIVLASKDSRETKVSEIMRTKFGCVGLDMTIDECRAIMDEMKIRYVPVVEKGYLVGMISIGDIINFVLTQKEFKIEKLEPYVQGPRRISGYLS